MSTTAVGKEAEEVVADYLKTNGHKIIAKNWRSRWCEIDIISSKHGCVYFTEVKFRGSKLWGDGFSYITPKKLKQMHFAAEFWLSGHNWEGESCLAAAAVDDQFSVNFVEV